jgi:BirA family biotin operon repressor/biotin-[acetyl-CoA-carboxylase] ligase
MLKYSHIHLDGVNSTNTYALELIGTKSPPEGTIITTSFQNNGKGMQANTWQSEAGSNLLFSMILYPDFLGAKNLFSLNQAVAISVCKCLQTVTSHFFSIKWPNDILCDDEKVCGVLIENIYRGMQMSSSVVGVGINVNQLNFDVFKPKAVSLKSITGKHFDTLEVLSCFEKSFYHYYDLLKQNKIAEIDSAYHAHLFRKDALHVFEKNGQYFQATIRGVNPEGKLLLEHNNGILAVIDVKEIGYVFN